MTEIVSRVNSGTAYTLPVAATRVDSLRESLDGFTTLLVDVLQIDEEQMDDTLAVEDRSSHSIRIAFRKKVNQGDQSDIDAHRLLVRQVWQRVNNHNSSDQRVKVWEADFDPKEVPDRTELTTNGMFIASIVLRVEVGASP